MVSMNVLGVIDELYGAALLPSEWPNALESLAAACGGAGAAISRGRIPEPALASPSLGASTFEYAAGWWRHDSRAPRLEAAFKGKPITDADLLTVQERARDPYYQDFLKPHGVDNFAGVILNPMPGLSLTVFVEGPRVFKREQLDTLSRLTPHLSRALATTARLGMTEAFSRDLLAASEHLNCGMILIRPDGRVGFANDQAERMLGDGLTIKAGALYAAATTEQDGLDRLIASLLSGSQVSGDSVFVTRPSGKSPLVVQGAPIDPKRHPTLERLGVSSSGGLLLVHDLAPERQGSIARELQRMGLTKSQARVAELVGSGLSVKQAADETGVVEGTARTQLKAAFARLGVSRQSELAILITKLGMVANTRQH
jgi:DNA-binding NarL/FixJ family response regulator